MHFRKDSYYIFNTFNSSEVRSVYDDLFVVWCNHPAKRIDRFLTKAPHINKVLDDFNFFFDLENLVCLITEII